MTSRVFDGSSWTPVQADNPSVVLPILHGQESIFVSVVSYRDGKRCGETLRDLFDKAKDPDRVVVGLVEQNKEDDTFCVEAYCQLYGKSTYRRETVRKDTFKVIVENQHECPRIHQIRKMAVHSLSAKGPSYARSLGRKMIGNEEFCLQLDAHSTFIDGWDNALKQQWSMTRNEFGIISTAPASESGKPVPRQCNVGFLDTLVPTFASPADGKVENLKAPLLGHAWSAGFSFAKCHLEEAAPYDPFMPYVMGVEQFVRFARFWTRGYDVYTPTENVVFHDYSPQPDGHSTDEWMMNADGMMRRRALDRARSILQLPNPDDHEPLDLNNLGIYGLGKRRSLDQLAQFVGINLNNQKLADNFQCANHAFVTYDANISPLEHLYSEPRDLEPQPDFPLRSKLTFHPRGEMEDDDDVQSGLASRLDAIAKQQASHDNAGPFPPTGTLFFLWIAGLIFWYIVFVHLPNKRFLASKGKGLPVTTRRKKEPLMSKRKD